MPPGILFSPQGTIYLPQVMSFSCPISPTRGSLPASEIQFRKSSISHLLANGIKTVLLRQHFVAPSMAVLVHCRHIKLLLDSLKSLSLKYEKTNAGPNIVPFYIRLHSPSLWGEFVASNMTSMSLITEVSLKIYVLFKFLRFFPLHFSKTYYS